MSRRVELLRLALRLLKKRQSGRQAAIAKVRRCLKLIEPFVPHSPAGTQTAAIDAGGVNAVRVAVRQARSGMRRGIDVWPRMPHAWHLYARIIPEGRHAIAWIGTFLQQRL